MATARHLSPLDVTRVQALVRDVNEGVRRVASPGARVEYLCECGNRACSQGIALTTDEYDQVRRFPTRFLVRPWHLSFEEERVVESTERYHVVEKFGESGTIAVRLDPTRRRLLDDDTDAP